MPTTHRSILLGPSRTSRISDRIFVTNLRPHILSRISRRMFCKKSSTVCFVMNLRSYALSRIFGRMFCNRARLQSCREGHKSSGALAPEVLRHGRKCACESHPFAKTGRKDGAREFSLRACPGTKQLREGSFRGSEAITFQPDARFRMWSHHP